MAVYGGAFSLTPGFHAVPVCFTGLDVPLFKGLFIALEMFSTAFIGGLIGFIASFVLGPEGVPQLVGAVGGIILGFVAGAFLASAIIARGACTCPPPAEGFCVCFLYMILPVAVPAPVRVIPIYPFIIPCAGSCATLVPPGCP